MENHGHLNEPGGSCSPPQRGFANGATQYSRKKFPLKPILTDFFFCLGNALNRCFFRPKKVSAKNLFRPKYFSTKNFSVENFAVRVAEGRSNGGGSGGAGAPPGPSVRTIIRSVL